MQGAASEKLIIEGADRAVRLCSEHVAERKREAAGGNAFAFVGGAATFDAQLAVRPRHGWKFASGRGSQPNAQEDKTGSKKDFDMCVHGVT